MAVFFTADTHFDDENLRMYENRPFANVAEMNAAIIRNWNAVVSDEDEVFLVGDVGSGEYVPLLKGKKYLIKGNHDLLPNDEYRKMGFAEVYDYPIVYNDFWIVSHEPMYVCMNMPYANIFGHVHSNPIYTTVSPRSYCVSVDRTEFAPVEFTRIAVEVAAADKAEKEKSEKVKAN